MSIGDDKIEQFENRLNELVKCAKEAGIACCDICDALLRAAVRTRQRLRMRQD